MGMGALPLASFCLLLILVNATCSLHPVYCIFLPYLLNWVGIKIVLPLAFYLLASFCPLLITTYFILSTAFLPYFYRCLWGGTEMKLVPCHRHLFALFLLLITTHWIFLPYSLSKGGGWATLKWTIFSFWINPPRYSRNEFIFIPWIWIHWHGICWSGNPTPSVSHFTTQHYSSYLAIYWGLYLMNDVHLRSIIYYTGLAYGRFGRPFPADGTIALETPETPPWLC